MQTNCTGCRRAKEAAAASEQEAAAAAEEAERAILEAEQREAADQQDDQAAALRQAAAKWTKRYPNALCLFTAGESDTLMSTRQSLHGAQCWLALRLQLFTAGAGKGAHAAHLHCTCLLHYAIH